MELNTDMAVDVVEILERFQEEFGLKETYKRVNHFMISYLSNMKDSLPEVAHNGLQIAEKFHDGLSTHIDLENARVKCWEFLDKKSASLDVTDPENCAVRAAICFLYADPPSDDLPELLEWFLVLANKVEDHSSEIAPLLERHFKSAP